jgi:hypothetical protein
MERETTIVEAGTGNYINHEVVMMISFMSFANPSGRTV